MTDQTKYHFFLKRILITWKTTFNIDLHSNRVFVFIRKAVLSLCVLKYLNDYLFHAKLLFQSCNLIYHKEMMYRCSEVTNKGRERERQTELRIFLTFENALIL